MKYKYAALVAVVVTTVSLAALAQKRTSAGEVFLLKAGGETMAELRVRQGASFLLEAADPSSHLDYNPSAGTVVATGGAILRRTAGTNSISVRGGAILKLTAGTNSVSVRADEIESVPDSQ